MLFGITKHGLVPPYAPAGSESDMPAFGGAYIASNWSAEARKHRAQMLSNR